MTALHAALVELTNKKLTPKVLATLTEQFLATKNSNGSGSRTTAYYDDNRDLVAVYCYYHKKWELVDHIAYGNKKGTKTGLNTMCKEGVSMWTKNNRGNAKAKDALLHKFTEGDITEAEFKDYLNDLKAPTAPEVHSDEEHSFDTLEQLEEYISAGGK